MEGVRKQQLHQLLGSLSLQHDQVLLTLIKKYTRQKHTLRNQQKEPLFFVKEPLFFVGNFFDGLEQRLHEEQEKQKQTLPKQQAKTEFSSLKTKTKQEHKTSKLEKQLDHLFKDLKKEEKKHLTQWYQTLTKIYEIVFPFFQYQEHASSSVHYGTHAFSLARQAWQEYFSLPGFIPKTFQYKKPKKGDALLHLVYYNEVENIDYEEIMEIQRASKLNTLLGTNVNYIDPEAKERYNLWKLFIFNQVMSFYYYDFAI